MKKGILSVFLLLCVNFSTQTVKITYSQGPYEKVDMLFLRDSKSLPGIIKDIKEHLQKMENDKEAKIKKAEIAKQDAAKEEVDSTSKKEKSSVKRFFSALGSSTKEAAKAFLSGTSKVRIEWRYHAKYVPNIKLNGSVCLTEKAILDDIYGTDTRTEKDISDNPNLSDWQKSSKKRTISPNYVAKMISVFIIHRDEDGVSVIGSQDVSTLGEYQLAIYQNGIGLHKTGYENCRFDTHNNF